MVDYHLAEPAAPWQKGMSQQYENVTLEQSKNVPLTGSGWMGAGRTATDEPSREDRLVTLRKAKKRLITQADAAVELGVSVRHGKRLLKALKKRGDKAVIHGLRGRPSPRRLPEATKQAAIRILSEPVYAGFGPTLAAEYLSDKHGVKVSKETLRHWMMEAQLWRGRKRKSEPVHLRRPRRTRCGELVQWDTSDHDWLEGGGERLYLISMIDDATSRLYARFVTSDSTAENMRVLWGYVEHYGRPLAFYTEKAALFQTAQRVSRDEPGCRKIPSTYRRHNRPRLAGAADRVDSGAQSASERPRRAWVLNRTGPAGEGVARGRN
jgi:hypothetical protein